MGTRGGGTGRVVFRDVEVPKENLIGGLHGGARVFHTMMVPERLCSAAPITGGMKGCLDVAMKYASRRKAFGRPIRGFQVIRHKLADMATQLAAARALTGELAIHHILWQGVATVLFVAAGATAVGMATAALADPRLPGRLGRQLRARQGGHGQVEGPVGRALPRREKGDDHGPE